MGTEALCCLSCPPSAHSGFLLLVLPSQSPLRLPPAGYQKAQVEQLRSQGSRALFPGTLAPPKTFRSCLWLSGRLTKVTTPAGSAWNIPAISCSALLHVQRTPCLLLSASLACSCYWAHTVGLWTQLLFARPLLSPLSHASGEPGSGWWICWMDRQPHLHKSKRRWFSEPCGMWVLLKDQ